MIGDQIGQGCVVEDAGGRVAHVEKYLVEGAVRKIPVNQFAQLLGIAEGRKRPVNQADDLAEMNVRPDRGATGIHPWHRARSPPCGRS